MSDPEANQVAVRDESRGITAASASAASIAVGVPLIVMMGLAFLATGTLFLLSSPLLLISGPLLVGILSVVTMVLAGFGTAAAMAVAGLCSIAWTLRQMVVSGGIAERIAETAGLRLKDRDSGDYLDNIVEETFTEVGEESSAD